MCLTLISQQCVTIHEAEEKTIAGFDRELEREAARRGGHHHPNHKHASIDKYTFHDFKAWDAPNLQPPPEAALEILHRLAILYVCSVLVLLSSMARLD